MKSFFAVLLMAVVSTAAFSVPAFSQEASKEAQSVEVKLPKIQAVAKGVDFYSVATPFPKTIPETEVIVFFWYGSPWVAKVDPLIRQWVNSGKIPNNVRIQWAPVVFDEDGAFPARVFYALQMMGKESVVSPALLQAVSSGRVNLSSPKSVSDFVTTLGISFKEFQTAINHPIVIAQADNVKKIMKIYDIQSSPSFVIDGQYLIPSNVEQSPEKATAVMMFMSEKLSQGGPRP